MLHGATHARTPHPQPCQYCHVFHPLWNLRRHCLLSHFLSYYQSRRPISRKFIVPLQSSMRLLESPIKIASFNVSAQTDNDTQARHTCCTHSYTCSRVTFQDDQEKSSQYLYTISWKHSVRFNFTKRHTEKPFCIQTFWLSRLGQLSPTLERPNWSIQVDCLIPLDLIERFLRNYPPLEWPYWLIWVDCQIFLDQFKKLFPIWDIPLAHSIFCTF